MAGALILITTKVGAMKEVYHKIQAMDEVEESSMVTGPYDILAIAEAEEMKDITDVLTEKIRDIEDVKSTVTNIFIE